MKKLLTLFAALLCGVAIYADDTDISTVDDALYIPSGTYSMQEDGSVVIPIYMKNETATKATGYQFDVTLPTTISASNVSFGKSTVRGITYSQFSWAAQSSGAVRLVAQTNDNVVFTGTDGEVATLIIKNAVAGEYTFNLFNEEISNSGTSVSPKESFETTVTINKFVYDDGYGLKIIPFNPASIDTDLDTGCKFVYISMQNTAGVKNLSYDIQLPAGVNVLEDSSKPVVATTGSGRLDIEYSYKSGLQTKTAPVYVPVISYNDDGTIHVVCEAAAAAPTTSYIVAGNDNVFILPITAASVEALSSGKFQLTIKNIEMTDPDGIEYNVAPYSADIYVGSSTPKATVTGGKVSFAGDYSSSDTYKLLTDAMPTDNTVTEIDLTGVTALPSGTTSIAVPNTNALIETSTDLGLTQNNVLIGSTCASLYITDGSAISYPSEFTATTAIYDRSSASVTKSKYATVYLPYSFDKTGLKVMSYKSYDNSTGTLTFEEITGSPEANTPYIIRQADAGTESKVSIKMTNSNSTSVSPTTNGLGEDAAFYGTYTSKTIKGTEDGYNYYGFSAQNGDFRQANAEGNVCSPFRAYFKIATTEAGARSILNIDCGDLPTGISETSIVETGENAAPIYRLDGTRVNTITKGGIYIQGGRKIVSK